MNALREQTPIRGAIQSWAAFVLGITSLLAVNPDTNRPPVPPALLLVRPLELLPAFPQAPRFESIAFPADQPVASVTALAVSEGRLWMSVRPWGDTNLLPGQGRLWTFSSAQNRIEPVQGSLAGDAVQDLVVRSDGLWLAVDGGLIALDPQTFVFDPFGTKQGITSRQFAGFATAGRRLFALAEAGPLFELTGDGRAWRRRDPSALALNPREPAHWRFVAGSGDWLLAAGKRGEELTYRHTDAPQWSYGREERLKVIPRAEAPAWTAVLGDQTGAFWLGSEAGLHFFVAETGSFEHHVAPLRPTIMGGWGRTFGPHQKPSAALQAEITTRQADELRLRMRARARLARVSKDLRQALDPITPTSRLPAGVRALVADGALMWVATGDPLAPERNRVLLLHVATRQWLGWFPVGRPVTALAVDAGYLYVGLDQEAMPGGISLMRVEKAAFVTRPAARWVSEAVTAAEWAPRLAALPVREQAVRAFFAGDFAAVVRLLANQSSPDAEALFLLAFAHDPIGLNDATRYEAYLDALGKGFPASPFAVATAALRQALGVPSPAETAPVLIAAQASAPVPAVLAESSPVRETVAAILARRDLNKDGKLNLIEFRLWRGPQAEVKPFDRNGDGQLDADELEAVP